MHTIAEGGRRIGEVLVDSRKWRAMIRRGKMDDTGVPSREYQIPVEQGGGRYLNYDVITSEPGDPWVPQAFVVEQPPRSVAGPHFHKENEFHVVIAGSGAIGRNRMNRFSLHYAKAFTGYGPLAANQDGLSYLTLRAVAEHDGFPLPECRNQMRPGPRLNIFSDGTQIFDDAQRTLRVGQWNETLIARREDGVFAMAMHLPPNGSDSIPPVAAGLAEFRVVVGGSMIVDDRKLPFCGCVFVAGNERVPEVKAGMDGLDVLILQLPVGTE